MQSTSFNDCTRFIQKMGRYGLVRAALGQDGCKGTDQDLKIQPQAAVFDISYILAQPVIELG
jgi:hypothetical protein